MAQTLGSVIVADCTSTIEFLRRTSPTGAGYCTQVAYASDNPNYDLNAAAAPPLQHVIASFGAGC